MLQPFVLVSFLTKKHIFMHVLRGWGQNFFKINRPIKFRVCPRVVIVFKKKHQYETLSRTAWLSAVPDSLTQRCPVRPDSALSRTAWLSDVPERLTQRCPGWLYSALSRRAPSQPETHAVQYIMYISAISQSWQNRCYLVHGYWIMFFNPFKNSNVQ